MLQGWGAYCKTSCWSFDTAFAVLESGSSHVQSVLGVVTGRKAL